MLCWVDIAVVITTIVFTSVTGAAVRDSSFEILEENSFPADAVSSLFSDSESRGLASDGPRSRSSDSVDPSTRLGPENDVMSSSSLSVAMAANEIFPTIHGDVDESSAMTSSASWNLFLGGESEETVSGISAKETVAIVICVTLLSLVIVVFSVVTTFLIRRRMRRKAYLRVKHASQTELGVHFIQNTPASMAARDAAMEQLFQSLASIDPDMRTKDYCQMNFGSDDRCLSPTESIASTDFIGGKSKAYSRSLPSLKNLNAHEEALNCNFANILNENSGKLKGRSRSFTERAAFGVDMSRAKTASRRNSEKSRNRILLPTAGKRFEKKSNGTSSRRGIPAFSRLARFSLLRNLSTKRKPDVPTEVELRLNPTKHPSDATDVVASNSKQNSNTVLDFEMPSTPPVLPDVEPMLTASQHSHDSIETSFQSGTPNDRIQYNNKLKTSQITKQSKAETDTRPHSNGRSNSHTLLQSRIQNGKIHHSSDFTIYIDVDSERRASYGKKTPSFEEIQDLQGSHRKTANGEIDSARKNFNSVGQIETSCKDRSLNNHNKQTIY